MGLTRLRVSCEALLSSRIRTGQDYFILQATGLILSKYLIEALLRNRTGNPFLLIIECWLLLALSVMVLITARRRLLHLGWSTSWAVPITCLSYALTMVLMILRIGSFGVWALVYFLAQLPLL